MLDVQDLGVTGFSKHGHWDYGGPGGWNHLDQLSVCVGKSWYGPGLTPIEQRSEFSLWAVLASPMIISVDVRDISPECHDLVTNERAIAVHQDPLGRPGRRLKNIYAGQNGLKKITSTTLTAGVYSNKTMMRDNNNNKAAKLEAQIWGRPLVGGSVAAIFFNRAETKRNITASFEELGLSPFVTTVTVLNIWSKKTITNVTSPFTAMNVEPHGVAFITFSPPEVPFIAKNMVNK